VIPTPDHAELGNKFPALPDVRSAIRYQIIDGLGHKFGDNYIDWSKDPTAKLVKAEKWIRLKTSTLNRGVSLQQLTEEAKKFSQPGSDEENALNVLNTYYDPDQPNGFDFDSLPKAYKDYIKSQRESDKKPQKPIKIKDLITEFNNRGDELIKKDTLSLEASDYFNSADWMTDLLKVFPNASIEEIRIIAGKQFKGKESADNVGYETNKRKCVLRCLDSYKAESQQLVLTQDPDSPFKQLENRAVQTPNEVSAEKFNQTVNQIIAEGKLNVHASFPGTSTRISGHQELHSPNTTDHIELFYPDVPFIKYFIDLDAYRNLLLGQREDFKINIRNQLADNSILDTFHFSKPEQGRVTVSYDTFHSRKNTQFFTDDVGRGNALSAIFDLPENVARSVREIAMTNPNQARLLIQSVIQDRKLGLGDKLHFPPPPEKNIYNKYYNRGLPPYDTEVWQNAKMFVAPFDPEEMQGMDFQTRIDKYTLQGKPISGETP
jgi:hypothetical protein